MSCGLFGKLPAKRDFIAVAVPRAVLNAWEPWIQGGLSASRLALGDAWTEAYLRAPIWRFWLGAGLTGEPVLGAFMSSADGVGRYFPLTLVCCGGRPDAFAPPEAEPYDGWFTAIEAFLLSLLTEGLPFASATAQLATLPDAVASRLPPTVEGARRLPGGALAGGVENSDVPAALTRLRPLAPAAMHADMSYWWTTGGEGFPAAVLACRGLPDAQIFASFLTGRFDGLA